MVLQNFYHAARVRRPTSRAVWGAPRDDWVLGGVGEPTVRNFGHVAGMFASYLQIVQRVDAMGLAGVDKAHEQVAAAVGSRPALQLPCSAVTVLQDNKYRTLCLCQA